MFGLKGTNGFDRIDSLAVCMYYFNGDQLHDYLFILISDTSLMRFSTFVCRTSLLKSG